MTLTRTHAPRFSTMKDSASFLDRLKFFLKVPGTDPAFPLDCVRILVRMHTPCRPRIIDMGHCSNLARGLLTHLLVLLKLRLPTGWQGGFPPSPNGLKTPSLSSVFEVFLSSDIGAAPRGKERASRTILYFHGSPATPQPSWSGRRGASGRPIPTRNVGTRPTPSRCTVFGVIQSGSARRIHYTLALPWNPCAAVSFDASDSLAESRLGSKLDEMAPHPSSVRSRPR